MYRFLIIVLCSVMVAGVAHGNVRMQLSKEFVEFMLSPEFTKANHGEGVVKVFKTVLVNDEVSLLHMYKRMVVDIPTDKLDSDVLRAAALRFYQPLGAAAPLQSR